ncbi:tol-pal system protein YbgF [Frateuria aurantia]
MLLAVSIPAHADDSRLSLADRVSQLEQAAQNRSQANIEQLNRIQDLQSQVQQLQGQVEELQHQLQQAGEQGKAQYVDLDSRLGRLEAGNHAQGDGGQPAAGGNGGAAPAATAPAAAAVSAPADQTPAAAAPAADPAQAQAAYNTAFSALRNGQYAQASKLFRDFIQQYPDDALTPNAFYWLGESYYVTMNYQVAHDAFAHLLSAFPKSEKAPDAMLKLGYTQYELKQPAAAVATLKAVSTQYPGSNAASLAQERLRRIQLSGGQG